MELSFDKLVCPVCQEILIEPIKLPCSHYVCKTCLENIIAICNLNCPTCRIRLSVWLRNNKKYDLLIDKELWSQIQIQFQVEIDRKLNGEDDGVCLDVILNTTTRQSYTPGELKTEYEKELEKYEKEREKERLEEELKSLALIKKLNEEEQKGKERIDLINKELREREEQIKRDEEFAKQLLKEDEERDRDIRETRSHSHKNNNKSLKIKNQNNKKKCVNKLNFNKNINQEYIDNFCIVQSKNSIIEKQKNNKLNFEPLQQKCTNKNDKLINYQNEDVNLNNSSLSATSHELNYSPLKFSSSPNKLSSPNLSNTSTSSSLSLKSNLSNKTTHIGKKRKSTFINFNNNFNSIDKYCIRTTNSAQKRKCSNSPPLSPQPHRIKSRCSSIDSIECELNYFKPIKILPKTPPKLSGASSTVIVVTPKYNKPLSSEQTNLLSTPDNQNRTIDRNPSDRIQDINKELIPMEYEDDDDNNEDDKEIQNISKNNKETSVIKYKDEFKNVNNNIKISEETTTISRVLPISTATSTTQTRNTLVKDDNEETIQYNKKEIEQFFNEFKKINLNSNKIDNNIGEYGNDEDGEDECFSNILKKKLKLEDKNNTNNNIINNNLININKQYNFKKYQTKYNDNNELATNDNKINNDEYNNNHSDIDDVIYDEDSDGSSTDCEIFTEKSNINNYINLIKS